MSEHQQESQKKREQFANYIRSEQRQRIFAEHRSRLKEAQRRQDEAEAAQAEMQMLELFDNHMDEYQMTMAMADKLEQEEREYQEYMEKLEEESINYEIRQKKMQLEQLRQEMIELFFGHNRDQN